MKKQLLHIFRNTPLGREMLMQSAYFCARAELELARQESNARIARQEWDRLSREKGEEPNPLVLYEPQLKEAQATLAAAKAELARRELDVQRTRVYTPFNCRIRSESIDPGQYIAAGQFVIEVAGTDAAEIVVPVPLKELRWLDIPRLKGDSGSRAVVRVDVGGQYFDWPGRIVRSLGDVDPKSRMARLVVQVADPYGLTHSAAQRHFLDLAEGLFVEVILQGRHFDRIFAIPANALRQNSTVWVMDSNKKLNIRKVVVLRREKDAVLINDGLTAGDRLILTHLSGVAEGMALRHAEEN